MNKIIITTDLGHFKAYRITEDPLGRPVIDLIESYDSIEGHGKLSEKLSDSAGRFAGGGREGEVAKGYGEPHNLELEMIKKLGKMIATDINALIKKEDYKSWYLAAGEKVNGDIIKQLDPKVKTSLEKNISSNLTKVRKADILRHFT